jgi:hypothetical protein
MIAWQVPHHVSPERTTEFVPINDGIRITIQFAAMIVMRLDSFGTTIAIAYAR